MSVAVAAKDGTNSLAEALREKDLAFGLSFILDLGLSAGAGAVEAVEGSMGMDGEACDGVVLVASSLIGAEEDFVG